MKFERSDLQMIPNPTEQDIIDGFKGYGEDDIDDFVILSQNDMTYVQSAVSHLEGEGFILEYQDGSLNQHYVATDCNIPLETILKIFLAYLKGDSSWKTDFLWELYVHEEEDDM